jgi:hypothetical protein
MYWEDECGEYEGNLSNKGCLIADFILEEDANQKSTGVFIGLLESYWLIDANNEIHKGTVGCGDGEYGEQFFGEWKNNIHPLLFQKNPSIIGLFFNNSLCRHRYVLCCCLFLDIR